MIVKISGVYAGPSPKGIFLENQGLTYEIYLTSYTRELFLQNKATGEPISLDTIYYIESNLAGGHLTPTLLGFTDEAEREFFQLFTGVAKVGVKTALTALSIPVYTVAAAIEKGDAASLTKLKGIGEKTAQKVIISLRGKAAGFMAVPDLMAGGEGFPSAGGASDEAMQVLLQLGHSINEAKKMIKDAIAGRPGIDTAEELLAEIYGNKSKPF